MNDTIPADLHGLAGYGENTRRLLELAYIHTTCTDDVQRMQTAGEAIRSIPGTPGHRMVAWEDLVAQVEGWREAQVQSDAVTSVEMTQDAVVGALVWALDRATCSACFHAGYVLATCGHGAKVAV